MKNQIFSPILGQSGVQNFFGEGYWYHKLYRFIPGFSFKGMTFVSKTTTWHRHEGNMPLRADGIIPRKRFPNCIWWNWRKGITLNAVGLSGPGAMDLVAREEWQQRTKPFWISFMSVAPTPEERVVEFIDFIYLLLSVDFLARWGLQVNLSCPNQRGITAKESMAEASEVAFLATEFGIPVMFKLSVTTTPEQAKPIADHPGCDALCVSNTIPFGALPDKIDWCGLMDLPKGAELPEGITLGPEMSPLYGRVGMPGGLSGPPLLPLVVDWVREARAIGISKHINAGGGVFSRACVRRLKRAGADSVSVGTVAMLRPWRLRGIIDEAHKEFPIAGEPGSATGATGRM